MPLEGVTLGGLLMEVLAEDQEDPRGPVLMPDLSAFKPTWVVVGDGEDLDRWDTGGR
jgi:hypothetical protein